MGLDLFYNALGGGGSIGKRSATVSNIHLGSNFRNLASPNMIYRNGSTYTIFYKDNVTYNNQVIITKTTNGILESTEVGSGTTSSEPLDHPMPCFTFDNDGYIYVFQNTLHIEPFRYWKSDSPEDISSFTLQTEFSDNAAYLGLLKQDNYDCTFVTRAGGTSEYSQSIIHLNLSTGVNTTTRVTDVDYAGTDIRHYPLSPDYYGTSDYVIGGICHRHDTGGIYYKLSLWITQDFETFENIGQTFSKDVVSTSEITDAELEANFAIYGTDSDTAASYEPANAIQIDNSVYFTYKSAANEYTIKKYTIGNSSEVASYTFPFSIQDTYTGFNPNYLYYNGNKIVLTLTKDDDLIYVCSISTDLTNFKEIQELPLYLTDNTGIYMGMPSNFDQIPKAKGYVISSRGEQGQNQLQYLYTNKKWS